VQLDHPLVVYVEHADAVAGPYRRPVAEHQGSAAAPDVDAQGGRNVRPGPVEAVAEAVQSVVHGDDPRMR
jgi:hypothetical protein